MTPEPQTLAVLRSEVGNIVAGSFFLIIGVLAFAIALVRRRGGVRILVWIGLWSLMFGSNMLAQSPAIFPSLPASWEAVRSLWSVIDYRGCQLRLS